MDWLQNGAYVFQGVFVDVCLQTATHAALAPMFAPLASRGKCRWIGPVCRGSKRCLLSASPAEL